MLFRSQNTRVYRELGITDAYHPLTHHQHDAAKIEKVLKIDRLHTEVLAYFMDKMKSTPDGDGTLLDHSMIVYGSALSDGNMHVHNDLPILLAGGGSGQLKGGRHIRYNGTPMSNMLLTMLDMAKIPTEGYLDPKYSDATGKLDILTL